MATPTIKHKYFTQRALNNRLDTKQQPVNSFPLRLVNQEARTTSRLPVCAKELVRSLSPRRRQTTTNPLQGERNFKHLQLSFLQKRSGSLTTSATTTIFQPHHIYIVCPRSECTRRETARPYQSTLRRRCVNARIGSTPQYQHRRERCRGGWKTRATHFWRSSSAVGPRDIKNYVQRQQYTPGKNVYLAGMRTNQPAPRPQLAK